MNREAIWFLGLFSLAFILGVALIWNGTNTQTSLPENRPETSLAHEELPKLGQMHQGSPVPEAEWKKIEELQPTEPRLKKPSIPAISPPATALLKVSYIEDSIWSINDCVLKLLGQSAWMLERKPLLAFPAGDVVILLIENDNGIACLEGEFIPAKRISGLILPETGLLSWHPPNPAR